MWSLILFAQTREDPLQRPEVIWGVVGLTVSLLAGAVVIYAVDQWRKRATAAATGADEAGSLSSFRAMFESGEITEEEYAELRRRVAEKVKKALVPKSDAGGGTPPAPDPAQPSGAAPPAQPGAPNAPSESPPPPSSA